LNYTFKKPNHNPMKKILPLIFISAITSLSTIAQTTQTFNYTGSVQTFIIPSCVTSITFDVIAASGGDGAPGCTSSQIATGGLGGRVQGTMPVNGGDTLYIYVGGAGADDNNTSAAGGFNGGGNALMENQYTYYGGGGGGGASDIRLNDTTLNDRVVVAGGGGGAGQDGCNCEGLTGGAGGGLTGGAGQPGPICVCNPAGQGGASAAGGLRGDWACTCDATDGAFGFGGNSNSTGCGGPTGGGGGGGGWYGGGGGGLGPGGGGSSYTVPSATGVIHTQDFQTGNGIVTITYTGGSGPAVALGNDTARCGGTVTLNAGYPGSTYLWSTTDTTQTITVSATGTYTVTVTDINGCTGTDVINVTINPLPAVTYSETQNVACINWAPITLTAGSPAGGTYSGVAVAGNTFAPQTAGAGVHVITYTYTDSNGCENTDTSSITVDLCTGIDRNGAEEAFEVFPNPMTNSLTIDLGSRKKQVEVTITNITGKIIYTAVAKDVLTLDVNTMDFAAGVYAVAVKDDKNGLMVRKVVKM
jgi:hypothetical protein